MKLSRIIKIIFLISLVFFFVTIVFFPISDCDACSFEYYGKKVDWKEAYNIFYRQCLDTKETHNSYELKDFKING